MGDLRTSKPSTSCHKRLPCTLLQLQKRSVLHILYISVVSPDSHVVSQYPIPRCTPRWVDGRTLKRQCDPENFRVYSTPKGGLRTSCFPLEVRVRSLN